jgi:hypothetical protein
MVSIYEGLLRVLQSMNSDVQEVQNGLVARSRPVERSLAHKQWAMHYMT